MVNEHSPGALLICDDVNEITRLRRFFEDDYRLKATSSPGSAVFVAASSKPAFIVFHIGTSFNEIFPFYKELRADETTKAIPLIIIADVTLVKPLMDNIEFENTAVISATVTKESMGVIVSKVLKKR
ncbi:hypothetical protein FACS189499_00270 [Clostridia bacterium]|nr:hypothetical protein FACS189499_00270 [Clostridia bacterium]